MTECVIDLSDRSKTSSSSVFVIHNSPFNEETDNPSGDTSKEKLQFLIEQRDKCLTKIEEFAHAGNFKYQYHVYHHPPVYTCEEASKFCPRIDKELKCGEMKNLFLFDKKKKTFYLISALADTIVDLKSIASVIGAKQLRFANEDQLKEVLNLIPGSVTPFGLVNDQECLVKYFFDKRAYELCEHFGFHPNACISTVAIHKHDFVRFMEEPSMGNHKLNMIDMLCVYNTT